jgi:hypothetical protein
MACDFLEVGFLNYSDPKTDCSFPQLSSMVSCEDSGSESTLHDEDICKGTENQEGITDNSDDEQSATDNTDSHRAEDCIDNVSKSPQSKAANEDEECRKLKIMDVHNKKEKSFPAYCIKAVSLTAHKQNYFIRMAIREIHGLKCVQSVHHTSNRLEMKGS